jgi:ketosteroid isomerase-like protein
MTKRTIGLLLAAAAATGLVAACAGAPQTTTSTTDDAREATGAAASDLRVPTLPLSRATLLAADARVANDVALRGAAGVVDHFTTDALLLLRRQELIRGKSAIAAFYDANPIGGTMSWRYVRGDVGAIGDLGYTLGWLEIVGPQDADGNAVASYAVYSAAWERGLDGDWKISAFAKTDLTGPPAAPPAGLLPLTDDGPVYPSLRGADATAKDLLAVDSASSVYTGKVGRQLGFDAYVDEKGISINDPLFFGRKSIFDSNAGIPSTSTLAWQPVAARASRAGDLGFTVGVYQSSSIGADGTTFHGQGKYLTVWRRQADGSFKWVLDGGNSSPPPAPAL